MNLTESQKAVAAIVSLLVLGGTGYATLDAKADKVAVETVVAQLKEDAAINRNEIINYNRKEIERYELQQKYGKLDEYGRDQLKILREKVEALQQMQLKRR